MDNLYKFDGMFFHLKKKPFFIIVALLGVIFVVFLFVAINQYNRRTDLKKLCTATTWGTVTHSSGDSDVLDVEYEFEVDGRTIKGSYYCRTTGNLGSYTKTGDSVQIHYNPSNVDQNYFGNHFEAADHAKRAINIAVFHLVIWLVISVALYLDWKRWWKLDELEDFIRSSHDLSAVSHFNEGENR